MGAWWYRAVGIAGSFVILGGGTADAATADRASASDPRQVTGLFEDLLGSGGGGLDLPGLGTSGVVPADRPVAGEAPGEAPGAAPRGGGLDAATLLPMDRTAQANAATADPVPALIGDALAARHPELFGAAVPLFGTFPDGPTTVLPATVDQPVADAPALAGDPSARGGRRAFSPGRPVAGLDPDFP